MAKKRKRRSTRKTSRSRARRKPRQTSPSQPLVSPDTARAIGAVLIILVGVVLLLSLFRVGGAVGQATGHWSAQLLGWVAIAVPFWLFWLGAEALASRRRVPLHHVIGTLIIFVSLSGILHWFVKTDELQTAFDGRYGGLVGYGVTATLQYGLGGLGSFFVLLALGAVGVFITLNRFGEKDETPTEAATQAKETSQRPPAQTPPPRPAPKGSPKRTPEMEFQPRVVDTEWQRPPLTLLAESATTADTGDTKRSSGIIETTLANFGIVTKVENVNIGPTVTQYELRPEAGVKLNQITALQNDLALALAAHPIRIEAPIPGKSTVGIEVPNARAATVRLRPLFSQEKWQKGGALPLALGLDVSGQAVIADLATMPHLLIAGATGAGKSVGINSILSSLLFTHSPKHLRLLLIDPKRVELTNYNDVPHLIAPVVVDPQQAINALRWVVSEMERRYKLFQERGVKNLGGYNKQFPDQTLPYLVVVIDELADIMAVAGKAVESAVVRIAQMARATGIHLVIATQRPSVDVITGLIKANFPTRMAFSVTSQTDSRTILDMGGAEKLLGRGDMLFLPSNLPKPIRVQGAFVDDMEVKKLTNFLKGKGEPAYDETVTETKRGTESAETAGGGDDPLYQQALDEVVRSRKASASLLQRRLKVGYARAARLLDMLEENGVIGPGEGAKPRQILVEPEDLD